MPEPFSIVIATKGVLILFGSAPLISTHGSFAAAHPHICKLINKLVPNIAQSVMLKVVKWVEKKLQRLQPKMKCPACKCSSMVVLRKKKKGYKCKPKIGGCGHTWV